MRRMKNIGRFITLDMRIGICEDSPEMKPSVPQMKKEPMIRIIDPFCVLVEMTGKTGRYASRAYAANFNGVMCKLVTRLATLRS